MKKVEEGEYVRISYMYRNTKIARIEKVLEKDPCYKNMQMYRIDSSAKHDGSSFVSNEIYQEDIIKHSKDLVSIIEVGDYINGFRIDKIVKNLDDNRNSFVICNEYIGEKQRFKQQDIRNIVTKEQFKEMGYNIYD